MRSLPFQRTDGALRLNVHFHLLVLDGVYVRAGKGDPLVFHALPTPTRAEVADVARRTAERIEKIMKAHGRLLAPQMQQEPPTGALEVEQPGLAACYVAAARGLLVTGERAGEPPLRLVVSQDPPPSGRDDEAADEPIAEVRSINVHAKQLVDGRDRTQLQRLCRYITRPPVATERLRHHHDGRIELRLKSTWKDGTRALLLEPHDLLLRLVAAVPPPRFHLLRYFGILSSHAALRAEVVPAPLDEPDQSRPPAGCGLSCTGGCAACDVVGALSRWLRSQNLVGYLGHHIGPAQLGFPWDDDGAMIADWGGGGA